MIISGWIVTEALDGTSFTGMTGDGKPIFLPICYKTRTYKSERAAKAAVSIIREGGYEGSPEVFLLDKTEVDDPPKAKDAADELYKEYQVLLKYGRIRYLRKKEFDGYVFAMIDRTGTIRDLGDQELFAFRTFIAELSEVGEQNIKSRLIAEGKDPEGLDDWRKQ